MDINKPVLVTGANGYVASWLVKRLLEEGFTVHAAVRDPSNLKKIKHLNALAENSKGSIVYFKSDLLENGSYQKAMEGCEVVFHTASPFITEVKNPQKDLIDPAVLGTQNVLVSANEVGSVKKVVLTSSCAAIYTDAIDCQKGQNGMLTEEMWNTTASINYQPYFLSKTLAEKKAWEINKAQDRWELVTINPSLVLGPMLNVNAITSESFKILKQMGDGTLKMGAPKMGMGLVDVRDVAEAHFQAAFNANSKGRYITSAHNTDIYDLCRSLLPKYGDKYPIPKRVLPKWLLSLVGPFINKSLTRKFIQNNVDIAFKADNSKIKKDLGITFRSLKETMEASFQILIDEKIIKAK